MKSLFKNLFIDLLTRLDVFKKAQGEFFVSVYDKPSISPFTISMCNACGCFGKPGIRMISPEMTTNISAPALITMSCTWNSKSFGTLMSFWLVENEY